MKKHLRHARILERLARDGEVTVDGLAGEFQVSVMTVRRDLAELARAGRVRRTHGGAVPARAGVAAFTFQDKATRRAAEKRAIAEAAAGLVTEGMAVSVDTGTTTFEVARAISPTPNLTVLTSSLVIASTLHARENIELVLLGGNVRRNNPDLMGPLTEENLRRFRVHLAVLGADAITPEGVFTTDVAVSRIARAMLENAERAVVVADSTKLMQTAFVRYATLEEVGHVITDDGCSRKVRQWLERAVDKLTLVSTDRTDRTRERTGSAERV